MNQHWTYPLADAASEEAGRFVTNYVITPHYHQEAYTSLSVGYLRRPDCAWGYVQPPTEITPTVTRALSQGLVLADLTTQQIADWGFRSSQELAERVAIQSVSRAAGAATRAMNKGGDPPHPFAAFDAPFLDSLAIIQDIHQDFTKILGDAQRILMLTFFEQAPEGSLRNRSGPVEPYRFSKLLEIMQADPGLGCLLRKRAAAISRHAVIVLEACWPAVQSLRQYLEATAHLNYVEAQADPACHAHETRLSQEEVPCALAVGAFQDLLPGPEKLVELPRLPIRPSA